MMSLPALDSVPWLAAQSRGVPHQVAVGPMLLWLGVAALAVGGVSVGVYLAHRAALRRRLNSHPGLFDGLCKAHQLTRGHKTLLWQVVRVQNVRYPGQVFTEPKWTHPKTLPAALQAKAVELGKLHKKLFG